MLDKEKYRMKNYIHFDHPIHINKVENYVCNPQKIARHSFLPLLKYIKESEKFIVKSHMTQEEKQESEFGDRPVKIK